MKLSESGHSLAAAAAKAGMSEKTARKYRRVGAAPSQLKSERKYRTRRDAFVDVWPEVEALLENDEGLQARTIFDYLCRNYPDRFQESQVRTLQRRIKLWRGAKGANREVFFPQQHVAGRQAQSDFTYMTELKACPGTCPGTAFLRDKPLRLSDLPKRTENALLIWERFDHFRNHWRVTCQKVRDSWMGGNLAARATR